MGEFKQAAQEYDSVDGDALEVDEDTTASKLSDFEIEVTVTVHNSAPSPEPTTDDGDDEGVAEAGIADNQVIVIALGAAIGSIIAGFAYVCCCSGKKKSGRMAVAPDGNYQMVEATSPTGKVAPAQGMAVAQAYEMEPQAATQAAAASERGHAKLAQATGLPGGTLPPLRG